MSILDDISIARPGLLVLVWLAYFGLHIPCSPPWVSSAGWPGSDPNGCALIGWFITAWLCCFWRRRLP